jgi:hypothetical protein
MTDSPPRGDTDLAKATDSLSSALDARGARIEAAIKRWGTALAALIVRVGTVACGREICWDCYGSGGWCDVCDQDADECEDPEHLHQDCNVCGGTGWKLEDLPDDDDPASSGLGRRAGLEVAKVALSRHTTTVHDWSPGWCWTR